MLCSIITVVVARNRAQQFLDVAPFVDRQAGERLVEQEDLRVLRHRHGDLDAPTFAVGGLPERAIRDVVEADAGERGMGAGGEIVLVGKRDERVPAQLRQSEQGEGDVVQNGVARKQGDDLVGPRHPRWARRRHGALVMSSPNSLTEPPSGEISPVIRLNKVVLPAPLGPMMRRRSPGSTARSTPW
jgi:hypothetical protein